MVIYELHLLMGANAAAARQKLSVAPISDRFFAYESFKLSHQSGKVRWQGYTHLSAVTMLLCILSSGCYMIYYNIIMINYTITAAFVTAVIHFGMARLGIASGEFDALIRHKFSSKNRQIIAPRGPAPDDISRKQLPSKQTMASYGKSLLWVLWLNSRWKQQQRWMEAWCPWWCYLSDSPSARRGGCCVCLARNASFTSRSWKIPRSFLPTRSEWIFTQPPRDPEQSGSDRQIHARACRRGGGIPGSRAEVHLVSLPVA